MPGRIGNNKFKIGVFRELDRSKVKNYKHLDKGILKVLESVDPGNKFSIPYMWGTTGIGYNVKKVQAAFGGKAPLDSWDLVLISLQKKSPWISHPPLSFIFIMLFLLYSRSYNSIYQCAQ